MAGRVMNEVLEIMILVRYSGVDFRHRITETLTNIVGFTWICPGAFAHHNTNEPRSQRMFGHVQPDITSSAAYNSSLRKRSPHPRRVKGDVTNVFEVGKLNFVPRREWSSPTQA